MDDFSLTDLIVESATQPLVLGRKYEVVDLDRTKPIWIIHKLHSWHAPIYVNLSDIGRNAGCTFDYDCNPATPRTECEEW